MHRFPRFPKLLCGLWIAQQPRTRILLDQRLDPIRIDVVGMLMGDRDGVEPGDPLVPVREVPRIEQDFRAVHLNKNAGVSEVGNTHLPTVSPHRTYGPNSY